MRFDEFFERATGQRPYGYQRRVAQDGLPAVIEAPPGTGKTAAVILGWLWRRRVEPAATPRRLIFALPQRTLVEQTAARAAEWLDRLGEASDVKLHVVMGGEGKTQWDWRMAMDQPAIVVGTIDSLVSKALNRGYGISRAIFPVDFALVTNGAHWVIDEVQLAPESSKTLRQLDAFTRDSRWPVAEPFGLTCMSATIPAGLLETVDNPDVGPRIRIEDDERTGELARRLRARRVVRRLPAEPEQYKAIAAEVVKRHRRGTLTLVVLNTVAAAREIFKALGQVDADVTLVHSRFRGVEREKLTEQITREPSERGHIVVATQVVEAGIDISAASLITEAAPWPSVVQRSGRCNRTGELDNAHLWWLPPKSHAPYEKADVEASVEVLGRLEGREVTNDDLLALGVPTTEVPVSVIRRADLLALFDTTADINGDDVDVAPFVRDADDLDVQLTWAEWEPVDGKPPTTLRLPEMRWRCRVPIADARALAKNKTVWRFDQAGGGWSQLTDRTPPRPGEVLLMAAVDGAYSTTIGFDPASKAPVPTTLPPSSEPAAGAEDAFEQDAASVAQRHWIPLQTHLDDTRREATDLLKALGIENSAVVLAAHLHDAGKVHEIWQRALCTLDADDAEGRQRRGPWAKSAEDKPLTYRAADGSEVKFRHELASLLLLDGPLAPLITDVGDPDLVRYLVLAHHGKLRLQVRGPGDTEEKTLLGLHHGESFAVPPLLGQPAGAITIDLEQFALGGERSWTRTALRLRDTYGPFMLAYLETLVRVADWRASANPTVEEGQ